MNPDPDWQLISGLWTAPRLESTAGQVVRLHVSVSVPGLDALAAEDVAATLVAGGQQLEPIAAPGPAQPLRYLQLRATAALADFAFANPADLTPEFLTVRVLNETATFSFATPGDLPIA